MRIRIWPYKQGSKSASLLAAAMNGRVLKNQGSVFRCRDADVIINWGDVNPPPFVTVNRDNIRVASNKLLFFRHLAGTELTPEFWETEDAIPDRAFPVVCRTVLAGHSGEGIVIADTRQDLVRCSLYVRYVPKQDEYRIHVGRVGNDVTTISVQQKRRRNDTPDAAVNWRVRNHSNGFVFVRNGVEPPVGVISAAHQALSATGLDFGAVDIVYNVKQERAYVIEVNTAPGLEGTTVEDYADFFRRRL